MTPYELGYQIGYLAAGAFFYLVISWLMVLLTKPKSLAKFVFVVGATTAALLILNGVGGGSLKTGAVAMPLTFVLLWLIYRKDFASGEDVTTLNLSSAPVISPDPSSSEQGPESLKQQPDNAQYSAPYSPSPSSPQAPYQAPPPDNAQYSAPYSPSPSSPQTPYQAPPPDNAPYSAPYSVSPLSRQAPYPIQVPYYARVPARSRYDVDELALKRTGGMLAAAILLLINSAIGFFGVWINTLFGLHADRGAPGLTVFLVDLLLAIGLFRAVERFRLYAIIRVAIGAVLLSIVVPILGNTGTLWVQAGVQALFAIGVIVMLLGQSQSGWRVAAGTFVVLFGWAGGFGWSFLGSFIPALRDSGVARWSVPDRSYSDDQARIRLDLPKSWVRLSRANPYIADITGARAILYDRSSTCFAAVIVEPAYSRFSSADRYGDLVLEARKEHIPSVVETGRDSVNLGGLAGRRLYSQWALGMQRFNGFMALGGDSLNYYQLAGWCTASRSKQALAAFEELETGFKITKSADAMLDEQSAHLVTELPYLSVGAARKLILELAGKGVQQSDYRDSA
ncbi:MAG TPA: hypothetical protein VJX67_20810, partial [Blastocatellia bacterium]|nr:hypothetical protein [Blastocatellia bacterium]